MNAMKRYTVKELSALSGVSVRTLHYYDEIGLLKPALVGGNGYRYYGRAQLLRLQQVLFYRELRFSLDQVRRVLDDPGFDAGAALRAHRDRLAAEAEHMQALIRTIDVTLADLTGEHAMQDHDLFKGFDPERQRAYEHELVQRYGSAAQARIEQSRQRTRGWSAADQATHAQRWSAWTRRFADALAQGAQVGDEAVQALVGEHHQLVCEHWTPDREAYIGLGRLYVEHPDFAQQYEALRPGLAQQLAEAMELYALRHL